MVESQEFIKEFAEEALMHVERIENNLLRLEKNDISADIIDELFRSAHSVKGAAGFFELNNIVKLSHAMEDFFGQLQLRDGNIALSPEMIDVLLSAIDCLRNLVEHAQDSENIDITTQINRLAVLGKSGYLNSETTVVMNTGFNMPATNIKIEEHELSGKEIKADISEESDIEKALAHGHKLYRINIRVNEKINIIALFKKIETIGNIIDSYSGFNKMSVYKGLMAQDLMFDFLFTTVLEKSLAALALDIPESYITDSNDAIEESRQLHSQFSMLQNIDADSNLNGGDGSTTELKKMEAKQNESVSRENSIRVQTSVLDDLLNLSGEMLLVRNQLLQTLSVYKRDINGLDIVLQKAKHIIIQLQERVMETRMQPVANVFNRFHRIVRELARKLGKEIELQLEGMDVELDKSIIESLTDPLTHLIRNAADHGIENPQVRESAGKPVTGNICIRAYHEEGYVKIHISDDGKGIDVGNIARKAIEKGLIGNDDILSMNDRDMLELIFMPGFSTVDRITDISGRGIGMDVVKTNIEKVRGSIEVESVYGKGTAFLLTLPLTVAVIPSLIVEVYEQKYVIPQVNIQEIVHVKPEDYSKRIERINSTMILHLRDHLLPVVHLSDILGLTGENDYKAVDNVRVLVIRVRSKRFGLIIDKIHDNEEILIKPLPEYIEDCKSYSGVTILGDGRIAMIIDPEGIMQMAGFKFIEDANIGTREEKVEFQTDEQEEQDLLLFKCSGHETFGIPLSMISRIEEIDAKGIEKIGDKEFINCDSKPLRVIYPEHFLPVKGIPNNNEKKYAIIPKNIGYPVGVIVDRIYDSIKTQINPDRDAIRHEGLLGSCIIDNRIVLLINLCRILEKAVPEYYNDSHQFILQQESDK